MFKQMRWIDRTFKFDFPVDLYPGIIERLRGTPARLDKLTQNLSQEVLVTKCDSGWSINEHCGHLSQVDMLWNYRFEEYLNGAEELMAADLSGKKTDAVDFNAKKLADILSIFQDGRRVLVARMEEIDHETASRVAFHPRLKQPMRLVDHAFFAAEHDDQHLATISEILHKLNG